MNPLDAFVHGIGSPGDGKRFSAEVQQWLQVLPGTVYVTGASWWLGELHFLSESVITLSQRAAADYRSHPELWLTQIAEPERHRLLERLQQALTGGESSVRLSYLITRPDATPCAVADEINIQRDAEGEAVMLVGIMRAKLADAAIDERSPYPSPDDPAAPYQDSFGHGLPNRALSDRDLLNHSGDMIMALDEDLQCIDIAGNTLEALGVAGESLRLTSLFGLMAPEDGSRVRRQLAEGVAESASPMMELRLRHQDGEYRWFEVQFSACTLAVEPDSPSASMPGWVAIARDVTRRRQQSLQWNTLVATDELTSALNREPFMGLLGQAFASGDAGMRFTLIVFDVDHFSDINHAWGREGGDLVLSCIGEMCRATLRERFSFGRLGDDAFALLMSGKSLQETATIAERLRGRFAATRVEFHGHWLSFSVSLGVAERRAEESPEAMLARAEAGMRAAKAHGRDRVQQAP